MKLVKSILAITPLIAVLFFSQSNLSSCQKQIITDTIFIKDTLVVKDTIRITDTVDCYDLTDSLVAYYNFNGGSLRDSSGYNNHITVNNNATKTADRFGRANNAYLFNGTTNYMTVPNSPSLNPTRAISLVAIVKINDFYKGNCTANQIFGKGWNDFINGFYVMRFGSLVGCNAILDTTKEVFYAGYGNLNGRVGAINDKYFIHVGPWYNVIYTYANGTSKLYVNGVLISTQTGGNPVFTPNTQELYIGKHGDPLYPYIFNGIIDELRIYKKELCQGEVDLLNDLKN